MSEARELLKRAASVLHDKFDGVKYMEPLIEEIDAYLAKPEPEPFGWFIEEKGMFVYGKNANDKWVSAGYTVTPLYPEHHARKPLSDDEIEAIYFGETKHAFLDGVIEFARAVEKAHGIK